MNKNSIKMRTLYVEKFANIMGIAVRLIVIDPLHFEQGNIPRTESYSVLYTFLSKLRCAYRRNRQNIMFYVFLRFKRLNQK